MNKWKIYHSDGKYCGYVHANKDEKNVKEILFDLRIYKPYAINTATGEVLLRR